MATYASGRYLRSAALPRSLAIAGLLLFTASAAAAEFAPAPRSHDAREVAIPMRDGKALAADVYVPRGAQRVPTVLVQTPYNKQLMRAAFAGEGRWGADSLFTRGDYAFVVTDWRGRFASAGARNVGVRPGGSEDGFDTVQWIAAQSWSDGGVGTWGPSALGGAQFRTAVAKPPALVCSVPMVMPLNLTYDVYFPGGVMWEEFVRTLDRLGWSVYDQLAANPVKTRFWDGLLATAGMRATDIEVPMLLVGGWYDIYIDHVLATFAELQSRGGARARAASRLVIGPWLHNTDQTAVGELTFPAAEHVSIVRAERFLDACLRGVGATSDMPAISYFQMGSEEWRSTAVWPPEGVAPQPWFLRAGGLLGPEVGEAGEARFRFDPKDPVPTHGGHVLSPSLTAGPVDLRQRIEQRADVVAFTSEPLASPLELAGPVKVRLHVSTDRTDTDFAVWVTDVYPDGRSMLLTEGIQRLRFREGTDREVLAEPGEVYVIEVATSNVAQTFLPGHRLRVLVSSSNAPKYAVNANDGGPMYRKGEGLVASNRVHFGNEYPSALLLPVQTRPRE